MKGPPGQGKSVLSYFLLSHLEKEIEEDKLPQASRVIYYFCDVDAPEKDASSVLRALIVQMCKNQSQVFRHLPNRFVTDRREFISASFETLWDVFQNMLTDRVFERVYCVIDGLDVYQIRMKDLTAALTKAFEHNNVVTSIVRKLFCTSRPTQEILTEWKSLPSRLLRSTSGDYQIFIQSRANSLPEQFTKEMRDILVDRLKQQQNQNFLWMSVIVRKVEAIPWPTNRRVREEIEKSPTELDKLYHGLVSKALESDPTNARILSWVMYTRWPLSLEELEEAISIDLSERFSQHTQLSETRVCITAKSLRVNLGNFLDIDENKVHVIHQFVKDYFERHQPLSKFTHSLYELRSPNVYIARICINYLAMDDFRKIKIPRRSQSTLPLSLVSIPGTLSALCITRTIYADNRVTNNL